MGIRPAKTVREWKGQAWARISKRKPRKSFVKGAPQVRVRQWNMGVDKRFELEVDVVPKERIQLRDNQLEAARQAANKYLEKNLPEAFFLQVCAYPHLVIREHSALGVAGADRISKGMKRAFGKPKGRMARVKAGQAVFRARIYAKDLPILKKGLTRAEMKLSRSFNLILKDISKNTSNLARSVIGKKMKEVKVEVKVVEPVAVAEGAAPAEGAKAEGAEAPAEKKAEAKPAAKGKK
ncbi:hypothetical protein AUJ14_04895 [Candidatus Micrarchaeota archaeon CG1_02_55_22]|nr:MAG: hypothetical protein AUJ14_04895 [Candidatus Micrarchaeota archaeon CG1_02_55_22]